MDELDGPLTDRVNPAPHVIAVLRLRNDRFANQRSDRLPHIGSNSAIIYDTEDSEPLRRVLDRHPKATRSIARLFDRHLVAERETRSWPVDREILIVLLKSHEEMLVVIGQQQHDVLSAQMSSGTANLNLEVGRVQPVRSKQQLLQCPAERRELVRFAHAGCLPH